MNLVRMQVFPIFAVRWMPGMMVPLPFRTLAGVVAVSFSPA